MLEFEVRKIKERGFVHELKDLSRKDKISILISEDVEKRRERAVTTAAIVEVRRTFSPPLLGFEGLSVRHCWVSKDFQSAIFGIRREASKNEDWGLADVWA